MGRGWRASQLCSLRGAPTSKQPSNPPPLPCLSTRCATWLFAQQALSLLPSEAHQSSDRALSLRAADGLISLFLKAAHSPPCKPSLLRPSLPDAMTNAISELYAKESCEAGEAALRAVQRLQQGLDSDGAQISVPAVSPLPKRGVCPICGREVGMESEDEWYVCGSGHRLQRCTLCFQVLSMRSWTCATCGAGMCSDRECCTVLAPSCALAAEPSVCGLCSSPCIWESIMG